jgi:tRNA U34 5-methylaminomethyl-2-thiouridine-forming methyltransferase MnmC
MKNKDYQALTPAEDALNIIRKCFQNEKRGNRKARDDAKEDLKKFLVKTDDGSYTVNSNKRFGKSETMHTYHGALTESLEKFVKPAKLKGKNKVSILDICSGLGYNAASCIEFLDKMTEIEIDMVEISPETVGAALLIENPVKSYEIIKRVVEEYFYEKGTLEFKFHKLEIPDRLNINIYIEDARDLVKKFQYKKKFDAIFLDPFSPAKSPELYTLEFFLKLKNLLKNDGIILTYTSAAPVRSAMVHAGLYVGEGPQFGRRGGTLAAKNPEIIKKPLSMDDERMIALSDAGIPFIDPKLNESSKNIIKMREDERKAARGRTRFASTVKIPIYLYKDIEEERLKRRVLRNIKMLGIDDLKSEEAKFIVCPQFNECICSCGYGKMNNSKDRINEMIKRLEMIKVKN